MAANEARRDLAEKLRFERMLADEIRAFNRRMVRGTVGEYGRTGRAFDASSVQPELAEILLNHYDRVGEPFSEQITEILPSDIEATDAETAAIAAALALFFTARAPEQAEIITGTNQRNIDDSITAAISVSQEEAAAGRPQTRFDIAALTGAVLSRKLTGRVTGIASLETQAPAETAKATEAQVLTGQPPSVTGGTPRQANVTKEWFTQGDERVREAHVLADSQEKDLNIPFDVGGELLRFPGDTGLGATAGNVINCRCSSVVSREDVLAIRRKPGEAPQVERILSEGLIVSIGDLIP